MNWLQLLSTQRYNTINAGLEPIRSPFLVDVDRIVYSSHFRKLQDKTQVHPLSKSDYVRTRLTHSLEVAGVGRSLGFEIALELSKKHKLNISEHDFGYILQAACLAHDIGNPPFGHLGEEAIKEFFLSKKSQLLSLMSEQEYNTLLAFDGNSQGFRIITNLAGWKNEGGLRLTYATLGAFCKYPCTFIPKELLEKQAGNIVGTHKAGVLATEKEFFEQLAQNLGLKRLIAGESVFVRHPLAFLIEAADDICYAVADIEDAFFVKIASLADIEKLLAPIARSPNKYEGDSKQRLADLKKAPFYKAMDSRKKAEWLRGKSIANLVEEVKRVFLENEDSILAGNFNHELLSLTDFAKEIAECKIYARKHIFRSLDKINSEIMGLKAIMGVLDELYIVIMNPNIVKSRRVENLLESMFGVSLNTKASVYEKFIYVIDLISDFTDRNIVEFYNILKVQ